MSTEPDNGSNQMAGGNGEPSAAHAPGLVVETVADVWAKALLDADDVGRLLSVPTSTVRALHEGRQLRGVRIGKYVRWKVATVREFVEALEAAG